MYTIDQFVGRAGLEGERNIVAQAGQHAATFCEQYQAEQHCEQTAEPGGLLSPEPANPGRESRMGRGVRGRRTHCEGGSLSGVKTREPGRTRINIGCLFMQPGRRPGRARENPGTTHEGRAGKRTFWDAKGTKCLRFWDRSLMITVAFYPG